ncbi:hypothetical protein Lesp01_81780 [Lentzea sp. NBRC 102530]|nr:hypothetical protein Lesp01_81780 [Lentzea sp. NBRC 102530]
MLGVQRLPHSGRPFGQGQRTAGADLGVQHQMPAAGFDRQSGVARRTDQEDPPDVIGTEVVQRLHAQMEVGLAVCPGDRHIGQCGEVSRHVTGVQRRRYRRYRPRLAGRSRDGRGRLQGDLADHLV